MQDTWMVSWNGRKNGTKIEKRSKVVSRSNETEIRQKRKKLEGR